MHLGWRIFLLGTSLAALGHSESGITARVLVTDGETAISGPPILSMPRWSGSRLVGCDECQSHAPILWAVDRQGRREETVLQIPESGYVTVWDVASGQDGAVAAVGYAISNDSRLADFIVWISPDRGQQVIMRVWPFCPYAVAVAPDGTVWAAGPVKHEDSKVDFHANVVRHYSPLGQLLATTTVRGVRRFNGLAAVANGSTLMVSKDRVGWLTHACDYIEFSFDGTEVGRYACPATLADGQFVGGVGLSLSNDLVIGGSRSGPLSPLMLDRLTHNWVPVPAPADIKNAHGILGFDGLTLVTYPEPGKLGRLKWAEAAH